MIEDLINFTIKSGVALAALIIIHIAIQLRLSYLDKKEMESTNNDVYE